MPDFKDRLRTLRTARGLSTSDIAAVLDVSERNVQLYEKGQRKPTIEGLSKLADYFGVSTDYLLGRTDEPR